MNDRTVSWPRLCSKDAQPLRKAGHRRYRTGCQCGILRPLSGMLPPVHCVSKKGKGFPYSTPSVGPGADPGVQALIHPAVGCHYFSPGLRLPPQPQSITALWPVPSYTAWWQRHVGVNNLPKAVTQRCLEQDLNPRPKDRKPKCLTRCTTAPPPLCYQYYFLLPLCYQ